MACVALQYHRKWIICVGTTSCWGCSCLP